MARKPLYPHVPKRRALVEYINSHKWWRTGLPDEKEVKARGVFFASSFKEAEFYGRPLDTPFKVKLATPLVGDELYILSMLGLKLVSEEGGLKERFAQDAEMMRIAMKMGYDSIALLTRKGYEAYKKTGETPRSIELQVFSRSSIITE